jgi:hypothetical protein
MKLYDLITATFLGKTFKFTDSYFYNLDNVEDENSFIGKVVKIKDFKRESPDDSYDSYDLTFTLDFNGEKKELWFDPESTSFEETAEN